MVELYSVKSGKLWGKVTLDSALRLLSYEHNHKCPTVRLSEDSDYDVVFEDVNQKKVLTLKKKKPKPANKE